MSPPDATRSFLTTNADPDAPPPIGISDVDKVMYRALGVPRGGWTLPVWLVVHGESVMWRWDGRHAGDRPALDEIPRRSPA